MKLSFDFVNCLKFLNFSKKEGSQKGCPFPTLLSPSCRPSSFWKMAAFGPLLCPRGLAGCKLRPEDCQNGAGRRRSREDANCGLIKRKPPVRRKKRQAGKKLFIKTTSPEGREESNPVLYDASFQSNRKQSQKKIFKRDNQEISLSMQKALFI